MSCLPDASLWRLEWADELSVGIPEIDAEHQQFIGLVNALNKAILDRMPVDEIKARMRAILDDAAAHFAHEEDLFRKWGYPDAGEHARRHEEIKLALHGIMAEFDHDEVEFAWIEAGLRIKKILIEHLLCEDMKYRDYRRAALPPGSRDDLHQGK